ncbi:MAG: hypothetical protein VKJ24_16725 [Synechococcales bacterium]|nr:hypothetical protein [Synechococcales bacterium]
MPRHNPYSIQLQISRLFQQGQSFFAPIKVQDWLRERGHDPADYDIQFHQQPAPAGSKEVIQVRIELKRKDGQPTDEWLQQELNQQS